MKRAVALAGLLVALVSPGARRGAGRARLGVAPARPDLPRRAGGAEPDVLRGPGVPGGERARLPLPAPRPAPRPAGGPGLPGALAGERVPEDLGPARDRRAHLHRPGQDERLRLLLSAARHQAGAHRDAGGVDLGRGRVERLPPPPRDHLHARAVGDHRERRREPHGLGGRDGMATADAVGRGAHGAPRSIVRGGGGPHDEPHAARPLDALLLEPRGPHERRLPGALPAGRGLGDLPRQDRLRPLAAGARAVRGPRLRARHGPQPVEEPPLPDLLLRLPVGEGLPRRLRSRQARGRRARGRPRHDAGQEVLDLGQRARRAHVGQDPHRRGRAVHRAHDRRLLRQPARLLVDPAGRDAHGRALLVPGARAGRGEGRQPRGRAQPRGEGRQGPPRRQHHDAAAGRAGAPPRRRPGRLRDDGHDRPRRALRARDSASRRHPGGRPAPRRPRGGRDGAGGVRGPPATEDRRAEALRAAAAARPGEDRGGAVPRGPAARAVPQPALRPGGLLPRGAAPRPRRRPHEHGPRRPRPAPRAASTRPRSASRPRSRA